MRRKVRIKYFIDYINKYLLVVREIIDRLKEEREINKDSLEEITQKYKL